MCRADGLKVYPTLVIRGTGLYELWKKGLYRNYAPERLVDLIARILALVPPWVRVYRIQRDIPMPLVTSGVEKGTPDTRRTPLWTPLPRCCADTAPSRGLPECHSQATMRRRVLCMRRPCCDVAHMCAECMDCMHMP